MKTRFDYMRDNILYQLTQKKESLTIFIILLVSFGLNIYGINWGLPSRWNFDQPVTTALNMLRNGSILPQESFHPSLYYYILILFVGPYLFFNYLFSPNFSSFLLNASVSWNYVALTHPVFTTGIFLCARLSSVLFSVLTVFVTYRIGKVIHSDIAGLFSALILALTMDFVNWAHFEKSVSLVNLLITLSTYCAVLVTNKRKMKRNYILTCLYGGLACSAKFNGGITLFLIFYIALWQFKKRIYIFLNQRFSSILLTLLVGIFVYLFSFFLSSPSILWEANKYFTKTTASYRDWLVPTGFGEVFKMLVPNLDGISYSLFRMFGLPLILIIIFGFGHVIQRYLKKTWNYYILFFFIILTLGLFLFSPRAYESPDSKYLSQAVPFFSILGGVFSSDLVSGAILGGIKRIFKVIGLACIFVISFFYCFSLLNIFTHNDLRYSATKWAEVNIPKRSIIIVNNPLEYSLGIGVLRDYDVYVLGREMGSRSSYSFINGDYSTINENKFISLRDKDSYYVIRSCWQTRESYSCSSLDRFKGDLLLLKTFERKRPWFWSPGLGGYEPHRVEVYKNATYKLKFK